VETDEADPVQHGYLQAVERFESALRSRVSVVARWYSFGSRRARVRTVGPRLAASVHEAWSHLEVPRSADERDELRIDLWHRAESHIDPPPGADAIDPFGRFPYKVSHEGRFLAMRQPETFAWLDREKRHLTGVVGDSTRRALYERSRPLEMPIMVWLRDEKVPLVHAAFVALKGRGALLLGRGGSGKSTLAGQCLCAGFSFLNDDKVAFDRGPNGEFVGYSLNSSLHVDSGSLARLPLMAAHACAPSLAIDDKYRIAVERLFPDRLCRSAPIRVLVIPRLERKTRGAIEAASKKDALLALSLSTLFSFPITDDRSLNRLAELAEAVPAYTVYLADDDSGAARVASLLERGHGV
jgi:hypothetical protein